MQAIADHAYHILIIAFVATTIIQAVVKIMSKPRNKKRGPVAPRRAQSIVRSACESDTRLSGSVGGSGWINRGGEVTLTSRDGREHLGQPGTGSFLSPALP